MSLSVRIEGDQLRRLASELDRFGARGRRMIRAAVHDTGRSVRAGVAKHVREAVTLKSGDIKEAIRLRRPMDLVDPQATVSLTPQRMPLLAYQHSPRQPRPGNPPRDGVRVVVFRGRAPEYHHRSFVARMASGHVGIFERVGARRLPIVEKFGPSVVGIFANEPGVERTVLRQGNERLQINLQRRLDRLIATGVSRG